MDFEADIFIGDTKLNFAQAMTLRVAIGGMMISLRDPEVAEGMGDMGTLYMNRLKEIQELIFKSIKIAKEKKNEL